MALYALDDVDDALDLTRRFLTPIDRTVWVKLAVVVFFIAGPGANSNVFQYTVGGNSGGPNGGPPVGGVPPTLGPRAWLIIAAVVGAILTLGLAFAFVGSVMEFVFVQSLRTETVTVRRYWSQQWRRGIRLFGFRLVLGIFVLGGLLVVLAPFLLPMFGFPGGVSVLFLLVLIPFFLVFAAVAGIVNGFTTVFVVPVMLLEECGVLAGWRRIWPTVTAQWTQYLAYAVLGFVLSAVGGLVVFIGVVLGALVLLVPFGILFGIGVGLFFVSQPVGIGAMAVVGILFGLSVLAVAALVQVPVQTYLRYYALLVLGDVDPDLDLIPDQRAAVREREGSEPEG